MAQFAFVKAYGAANVRKFLRVNFTNVPIKNLADRIKSIFALGRSQGTIQNDFGHGNFDLNVLELPSHGLLRAQSQIKLSVSSWAKVEVVASIDRYGHCVLRSDQV